MKFTKDKTNLALIAVEILFKPQRFSKPLRFEKIETKSRKMETKNTQAIRFEKHEHRKIKISDWRF